MRPHGGDGDMRPSLWSSHARRNKTASSRAAFICSRILLPLPHFSLFSSTFLFVYFSSFPPPLHLFLSPHSLASHSRTPTLPCPDSPSLLPFPFPLTLLVIRSRTSPFSIHPPLPRSSLAPPRPTGAPCSSLRCLASERPWTHFDAQLLSARGMRGTISISGHIARHGPGLHHPLRCPPSLALTTPSSNLFPSFPPSSPPLPPPLFSPLLSVPEHRRAISRGTAPAYTIRFSDAVDPHSPPTNLFPSVPPSPLLLPNSPFSCLDTPGPYREARPRPTPSASVPPSLAPTPLQATSSSRCHVERRHWERRMRGVDARQGRALEDMLTAVGEGGGSGEDSAAVGEGSDAAAGYGVSAAAVVEGGEEGHDDLLGALQRSREYSHGIIIPRYPPQDPRLEVRLKGGMGKMGERGELGEGLSGAMRGGAFMLGAFKDGHVVVNYDIRVIGPAQKPSAINLLVDYPDPSSLQASSLQVASLQCDSWAELKPQMWRGAVQQQVEQQQWGRQCWLFFARA
ncbi:unnamed protein product, partial [Closterium sp. NIES-64]